MGRGCRGYWPIAAVGEGFPNVTAHGTRAPLCTTGPDTRLVSRRRLYMNGQPSDGGASDRNIVVFEVLL
jgi:hypothetical protein